MASRNDIARVNADTSCAVKLGDSGGIGDYEVVYVVLCYDVGHVLRWRLLL